jgi:hypothetical protein
MRRMTEMPGASEQIPEDVKPIRRAMCVFTTGSAMRGRQGNVFLFPDRIAHVSSFGAQAMFGVLGLLISRGRAEGRARRGGRGVDTVMLRDVTAVRPARYGVRGGMTEVDTQAGGHYRIGVRFSKWQQPLRDALTALGLQVSESDEGIQVAH